MKTDRHQQASEETSGSRRLVSLLAGLSLLLAALSIAPGASSASATDEPSPTQYGYKKVLNKAEYMEYYMAREFEVLHIDTEHQTSKGFYIAIKTSRGRGFQWRFQEYGQWCLVPDNNVAWNGWMNNYTCMPDQERFAERFPAWPENGERCRNQTGYPWKNGGFDAGDTYCRNTELDSRYDPMTQKTAYGYDCAPFEEKRGFDCYPRTYDWVDNEPNSEDVFWLPEPDPCTSLPSDANRVNPAYNPDDYVPASGGDSSCTGAAPAPNCATAPPDVAATQQACTGVEPVESTYYSGEATATESATADATVTVSRSATAQAKRYKASVQVTKRKHGRTYKARGVAWTVKRATRSTTLTDTLTGEATATVTATCASTISQEEADACALADAQEKARSQAEYDARNDARNQGTGDLASQAKVESRAAAKEAVRTAIVTAADRTKAKRQARRVALRKLRQKMN